MIVHHFDSTFMKENLIGIYFAEMILHGEDGEKDAVNEMEATLDCQ